MRAIKAVVPYFTSKEENCIGKHFLQGAKRNGHKGMALFASEATAATIQLKLSKSNKWGRMMACRVLKCHRDTDKALGAIPKFCS